MASLRFNYSGDKRPERGRGPMNPYMPRSLGYVYGYPAPFPVAERYEAPYTMPNPAQKEATGDNNKPEGEGRQEDEAVLTAGVVCLSREETKTMEAEKSAAEGKPAAEEKPAEKPAEEEIQAIIPEGPEETAKTASEKLLGKLEVFESGITSTREQLNLAKVYFDEIIYKMESFQQILDILKSNEERKTAGISSQTVSSKTTNDSIDDFLEILQTPALQNILRQLLLGILR